MKLIRLMLPVLLLLILCLSQVSYADTPESLKPVNGEVQYSQLFVSTLQKALTGFQEQANSLEKSELQGDYSPVARIGPVAPDLVKPDPQIFVTLDPLLPECCTTAPGNPNCETVDITCPTWDPNSPDCYYNTFCPETCVTFNPADPLCVTSSPSDPSCPKYTMCIESCATTDPCNTDCFPPTTQPACQTCDAGLTCDVGCTSDPCNPDCFTPTTQPACPTCDVGCTSDPCNPDCFPPTTNPSCPTCDVGNPGCTLDPVTCTTDPSCPTMAPSCKPIVGGTVVEEDILEVAMPLLWLVGVIVLATGVVLLARRRINH